ncbi:hypothetical protein LWI29_034397 [Acer saccharum]|uniref:Protein FAR1-RELATED SEQUENCE n=1 Tax=Acer saccharum TaxID=4024 RepID=A0AA39RN15_ACESA|nr:hypothetical protein LWI29_034397 [Acer saccharum]
MSTRYTHEVLKKFQVEVLGASGCFFLSEGDIGLTKDFKVQDFEKNVSLMVTWDEKEQDARCLCRMYEYYGFLCRHAICVLQSIGIFNISSYFILKRWTKDVRGLDSVSYISNGVESKKQRFDELFYQATKLSEEALLSHESFTIAYHALQEALEKCATVNYSLNVSKESKFGLQEFQDKEHADVNLSPNISLLDPQISITKGAPKRMKSGIKKSNRKKIQKLKKG